MKTLFLILIGLLLLSCQEPNTDIKNNKQIKESLELKYAKWFTVEYLPSYKRITVLNPWTKEKYWEYHISKSEHKNSLSSKQSVLSVPKRSIVLSSTQIGMFEKLSIINTIIGVSNGNYIYNPKIRKRIASKKIIELGDGNTLNTEKAFLSQADIIFTTAWDKIDLNINKLIEQDKPVAFVMDWQEGTPLARAEWIKFIAAFYDLEDKASLIFDSIEQNYIQLKSIAQKSHNKPSVMHGTLMSGTWYIAGGRSFAAQFYKDANANYLWSSDSSTGSLPLSFENVFNTAKDAQFWFNSSSKASRNDLLTEDSRFALFLSYQNNRIFSNTFVRTDTLPNPLWEEGTVNPDLVLKDIIAILHPEVLTHHSIKFYRKIE